MHTVILVRSAVPARRLASQLAYLPACFLVVPFSCLFDWFMLFNFYLFVQYQLGRFSIECRKTKTKVITASIIRKTNITGANENSNTRQARENASNQVMIGFCFASDWLRERRELSSSITERGKAKPMQCRFLGLLSTLN